MSNYDDPCSLNSTTDYTDYNCYGFAFGTLTWEEPQSFDHRFANNEERIDSCVEDIMRDHTGWKQLESYKGVPEETDVVGFRIGITRNDGHADFHFILRHNGQWYEKPGGWQIEQITYDVDSVWPHGGRPYNSRITWFVKTA